MKCCDECLDKYCKSSGNIPCPAYLEEMHKMGYDLKISWIDKNEKEKDNRIYFYTVEDLIKALNEGKTVCRIYNGDLLCFMKIDGVIIMKDMDGTTINPGFKFQRDSFFIFKETNDEPCIG